MTTSYKPKGYSDVIPYLMVTNTIRFVEFIEAVFGGVKGQCMMHENGTYRHGEIQIGDSTIMFSEAAEGMEATPLTIYIYAEDADATYKKGIDFGAESIQEPKDMYYGDRNAAIQDVSGNKWWIATHKEDVSDKELAKRLEEATAKAEQKN